jgi:hypothetical protein
MNLSAGLTSLLRRIYCHYPGAASNSFGTVGLISRLIILHIRPFIQMCELFIIRQKYAVPTIYTRS